MYVLLIAGVPAIFIGFAFLFGLVFGSFGNVIIYRLPIGESIRGRSHCPQCNKTIEAICLIPVISYLLLRGKCRYCHRHISWQYPLVELGSGFLAVVAAFLAPSFTSVLVLALALWVLLIISVFDAHTQGIPDIFNILFIALAFLYTTIAGEFDPLAFVIGVGFFGSQWLVSRGRWIGSGDVLLSVGLSALLGKGELVIFMLFSSYIIGAFVASALLLTRRITRKDYIAFGPFLAVGALVALIAGERIMSCLLWSSRACIGIPFF